MCKPNDKSIAPPLWHFHLFCMIKSFMSFISTSPKPSEYITLTPTWAAYFLKRTWRRWSSVQMIATHAWYWSMCDQCVCIESMHAKDRHIQSYLLRVDNFTLTSLLQPPLFFFLPLHLSCVCLQLLPSSPHPVPLPINATHHQGSFTHRC